MTDKRENLSADALAYRKSITFEQTEGVEPLPTQLQSKELSKKLRAALWAIVHAELKNHTD